MKKQNFLFFMLILSIHPLSFAETQNTEKNQTKSHVVVSKRPEFIPKQEETISTKEKTTHPGDATFTPVSREWLNQHHVNAKKCGKSVWQEPARKNGKPGTVWCDMAEPDEDTPPYMNQTQAIEYCHKIGAELPNDQDFIQLRQYMGGKKTSEEGYKPQVLPHLTYVDSSGVELGYFYWSSTILHNESLANGFFSHSGRVDYDERNNVSTNHVRCVVKNL